MNAGFFLCIFFLIPFKGLCQHFDKPIVPHDYLALSANHHFENRAVQDFRFTAKNIDPISLFNQGRSGTHLNPGQRLCVVGTLSLLAVSFAVQKSNSNLAIGLESAAVVTSAVGLVWYVNDQKRK